MKPTRRQFLALAGGASIVAGCAPLARRLPGNALPKSTALPSHGASQAARLLNRAGYGPRPGSVAEVEAQGHAAWLEAQLHPTVATSLTGFLGHQAPQDGDYSPMLLTELARLDVWQQDSEDLLDLPEDEIIRQLNQADLLRAVYSPWQVKERIVAFWGDHFNIYAHKGHDAFRQGQFSQSVVRTHALTTFPQLLKAVAHSPAMLVYLDNQLNARGVANENYARELMELHTMGVHGGYSQKDVQEVARCFTGWTFERRFLHRKGEFRFDGDLHDDGEKVVLGHRIPEGGGQQDAETVLDLVGTHPATAKFIAGKLCRHYLGESDHPLRARVEETFTKTGGDIPAMLKVILLSEACLAGPPVAKRPIDFVASALRSTGATTDCGPDVQKHLADMGQELYTWPMPDGYPDRAAAWTGSMLGRWNFALALGHGKVNGTTADLGQLAARSGHPDPHAGLVQVLLASATPPIRVGKDLPATAALCLASTDFQQR